MWLVGVDSELVGVDIGLVGVDMGLVDMVVGVVTSMEVKFCYITFGGKHKHGFTKIPALLNGMFYQSYFYQQALSKSLSMGAILNGSQYADNNVLTWVTCWCRSTPLLV